MGLLTAELINLGCDSRKLVTWVAAAVGASSSQLQSNVGHSAVPPPPSDRWRILKYTFHQIRYTWAIYNRAIGTLIKTSATHWRIGCGAG